MAPSHLLPAFLALICTALGDYHFTQPVGGASISDTSFTVNWHEGPTAPAISETLSWGLGICTGGDTYDTIYDVQTISAGYGGPPDSGGSMSIDFDQTMGGNMPNAYFICMQWQTNDSDITNYSERFSLTAMTGTFTQDLVNAIGNVHNTTAPPRNYTGPSLTTSSSTASSSASSTAQATSSNGSNIKGSTLSALSGAGIGIGGLLFLIALIAVVILLLRRKRRQQARTNPRTSKLMAPGTIQQLDSTSVNWMAKPPIADSYELHSPEEGPVPYPGGLYSSMPKQQQQQQPAPAYAYELPSRRSNAYELGN